MPLSKLYAKFKNNLKDRKVVPSIWLNSIDTRKLKRSLWLMSSIIVIVALLAVFWLKFLRAEELLVETVNDEVAMSIWYPPLITSGDTLRLYVNVANNSISTITPTVSLNYSQAANTNSIIPDIGMSTSRDAIVLKPGVKQTEEFTFRVGNRLENFQEPFSLFVILSDGKQKLIEKKLTITMINIALPLATGNLIFSNKMSWAGFVIIIIAGFGALKTIREAIETPSKNQGTSQE